GAVDLSQAPGVTPAAAAAAADADARRREELERVRRQALRSYEVTTITSDIKGAGCNSQVFMVITGAKTSSGELRLENAPNNFQRGKTDNFTFELPIVRTLRLGAKPNTTRVYKVVVKTSDVKGAGTDANVYLTLFGEQEGKPANSGPQRLENNANNFEVRGGG
ncbi:uncharacterized protein HaLaN_04244, partial [Haematococcus lacustris]